MNRKITLKKIGTSLYDVLVDGRQSSLSVYFESGQFHCYQKDFINIKTNTLQEMETFLSMEV